MGFTLTTDRRSERTKTVKTCATVVDVGVTRSASACDHHAEIRDPERKVRRAAEQTLTANQGRLLGAQLINHQFNSHECAFIMGDATDDGLSG
jgi:hypothetical protein